MRPDGARKLADAAAHAAGGLAAVFAGEGDSYVYALVRADGGGHRPPGQAAQPSPLTGPGREAADGFAQGSVRADEAAIRAFFESEGIAP